MPKLKTLRLSPMWLLWLTPFVLLSPVWLTGQTLYWGTPSTQFLPWWWQAWLTLRAGEWPLWNPLVGMGAPLIANYQSALFYPPNWLYFLLAAMGGLRWMAWGQAILVAAHLGFAGWGMAGLVRRLGIGDLGQLVGGLAFGLSSYLVGRAHFLSMNSTLAWLPWVLLATYELVMDKAVRRPVLKLALYLALQWLAGHAQLSAYTLVLTAAWAAFWTQQSAQRAWLRNAGRLAVAGALALALSAVQLLPTAEYLLQSARAEQVEPALAMTYSFWPWRLLTLLAPNLFGSPALSDYWGYGNYWEDAIYIGSLPMALVLLGLMRSEKNSPRQRSNLRALAHFLSGVSAVALILALGANTPVFPWVFAHVPGFDLFQAPSRFMIWAVVALALLAALGAQRWRPPAGRGLYWSRLAVAGGVAILIGGLAASILQATGRFAIPTSFGRAAVLLGVNAVALAALNLWVWRLPVARRTWLVGLVLAADLLVAGWGLNPAAPLNLYAPETGRADVRAQLDGGRLYLPAAIEAALKFERLFRFDTFYSAMPSEIRASLLPNTNLFDGIPSGNNFDPLVPARYQQWVQQLESPEAKNQYALLAMMNVTLVEQFQAGSYSFLAVPTLPRARVVPCVRTVASSRAAFALLAGTDPRQEVIVESSKAGSACTDEAGVARIQAETANSVTISVSGEGWLVLADTWYPDWHAYADGVEVPVHPANGLFRAVELPADTQVVEFVYRPLPFAAGLFLSLLAWPAWTLAWKREPR